MKTIERVVVRTLLAAGVLVLSAVDPAVSQVPTPESVLGHPAGADFELASWDETMAYFEALDGASDHLELRQIGYTAEGRPWMIAMISTPENLRNLDRIQEISLALAHPEGLSDEEARQLAEEGKAVVHIDGGLHSTEAANTQHTLQFAYDLLSATDDEWVNQVLSDVVLMLWPSLNPDGLQMMVEWYEGNVGTSFEVAPMPMLYQKYVGHDNNRDAYMLNMVESRVVNRVWREWEPQIIHVHHQSSPFPTRIWLPPFAEPVSPRAPALISRTVNMLGMAMARALEENGQPGATHMDFFDAWYPGYVDYLPILQNSAAYWTETALYRYATPHFYTVNDFPRNRRDLRAESLYSSPWQGGWWRIGDAVAYMNTASKAVLDYASRYKEELLYNRYQAGRDQIAYYAEHPPYAYFMAADQRDPVAVVELLRRLAALGAPVKRLTSEVTYQGVTWAPGTWVVETSHEYGEMVRALLEVQAYPDLREFPEGPPSQPYDVAGWTLGYLMGVRVVEGREPLTDALLQAMEEVRGEAVEWQSMAGSVDDSGRAIPIDEFASDGSRPDVASFDSPVDHGFNDNAVAAAILPPVGRLRGSGGSLLLDPAQNNTYRAINEAWRRGGSVRFQDGDNPRYSVQGLSGQAMEDLVQQFALQATRGSGGGEAIAKPRIGLYRPWRTSMDEGWTRWLLERFGFEFQNIRDAEVRAGTLGARFDVIVLPSESPGALKDGHAKGSIHPRYTGGMGDVGVRALDEFVRQGGRIVAMNRSTALAINEFNLPVVDVLAGVPRGEFYSAGSILEVWSGDHPVMAGMPERAPIFFDRSPAFETGEGFEGQVLATYAPHGNPLQSGYLLGEEHLHGKAAAVIANYGDGDVVLLGLRPQWRGQTFGSFRILFNALLPS